jgi:O-succinylbenzoic acid--CoA ligase
MARFDADEVAAAARHRGATLTALVPTALARTDVTGYRCVIVGGAAPPADRAPNVVASYAMTETGSTVALDGIPLRGVELRVVDGEVQVRGPMLLRAYRDGTDPRTPDGWLPTGDEGRLDDTGRLEVFGRRGDVIVTGGEKVWPAAVEAALAAHPGVAAVAVVGRPDEEWGATVTALVEPRDPGHPPTLEDLRAHVRRTLPAYAAPKRLELCDALPRAALGKVRRRGL